MKLAATALSAVTLLALGSQIAAASSGIELSPKGSNRASGRLTFTGLGAEFITAECRVTLTLASVGEGGTVKSASTVLANVTGVAVSACEHGTVIALAPSEFVPWRVTYRSFAGSLPSISSVRLELRGVGFLIASSAARCLFGGNFEAIMFSPAESIRAEVAFLPVVTDLRGLFSCPAFFEVNGTLTLERTIRLRLV